MSRKITLPEKVASSAVNRLQTIGRLLLPLLIVTIVTWIGIVIFFEFVALLYT